MTAAAALNAFLAADSAADIHRAFRALCDALSLPASAHAAGAAASVQQRAAKQQKKPPPFYGVLRKKLPAAAGGKEFFAALDDTFAAHAAARKSLAAARAASAPRVLIVGAGFAGLRQAVEAGLLGCPVTLVDARRAPFAQQAHLLELQPFLVDDLLALDGTLDKANLRGTKFYHAPQHTIHCVLLRAALLLGARFACGCTYTQSHCEPPQYVGDTGSWTARLSPAPQGWKDLGFDILVGCGGWGPAGTVRAEHGLGSGDPIQSHSHGGGGATGQQQQQQQTVGVVVQLQNGGTAQENALDEFRWPRRSDNKPLFAKLRKAGYNLEGVVYFRSPTTHCYLLTATADALRKTGALRSVCGAVAQTCAASNTDVRKLEAFARGVTDFFGLPRAVQASSACASHIRLCDAGAGARGCAAEPAKIIKGGQAEALVMLAGDALVQPAWSEGLGVNAAWLSVLDNAHLIHGYATNTRPTATLLEERRCAFEAQKRLLSFDQRKAVLLRAVSKYAADPKTRYKGWRMMTSARRRLPRGSAVESKNPAFSSSSSAGASSDASSAASSSSSFSSLHAGVPACVSAGVSRGVSAGPWRRITRTRLEADERRELNVALFKGSILLCRCDADKNWYSLLIPPPRNAPGNGQHIQSVVRAAQKQGRRSGAKWLDAKKRLGSTARDLFACQMRHVLENVFDDANGVRGCVAIVRTLDELASALDPPRFGDALVKCMPKGRRAEPHEMLLGLGEVRDKLDALLAEGMIGRDAGSVEDQEHSVLLAYNRRFRWDHDDGLPFESMSRQLFDRAKTYMVGKEAYAERKKREAVERAQRIEAGKRYRQQAKDIKEGKISGVSTQVGMVNELKAAQLRRANGGMPKKKMTRKSPAATSATKGKKRVPKAQAKETQGATPLSAPRVKPLTSPLAADPGTAGAAGAAGTPGTAGAVPADPTSQPPPKRSSRKSSLMMPRRGSSSGGRRTYSTMHAGWLLKAGKWGSGQLRNRLFVLQVDDHSGVPRMAYFRGEKHYVRCLKSGTPSGWIPIASITRVTAELNTSLRSIQRFGLRVATRPNGISLTGRVYEMYAPTSQSRDEWLYFINKACAEWSRETDRQRRRKALLSGSPSSTSSAGRKLFALSLEELSRTYTIPGARGNNAVQTLDAGQLEELRDQAKEATEIFAEQECGGGARSEDEYD